MLLCLIAALGAISFFSARAGSQETDPKKAGAAGGGEQDEMMKKMMEAAAPGEHHKHLDALIGTWETTTRFWMSPEQEGESTKGISKRKWIMGGRFITDEVEGTVMGKPFNGFGITGYDNVSKKYVSSWVDDMGTGILNSVGTCDAAGRTFTYVGEYNDCMSGQKKSQRLVTRIVSGSKNVFEMYDKTPDGKEYKSLEVTYTRK